MTQQKKSTPSLKMKAYNTMKERLKYCQYAPGNILNEAQIASELGISRTPVREAISLLENEGYLKVIPKKGIYVTDILLKDVMQIFQVRMEIEPICIKMAGPNIPIEELVEWREKFKTESNNSIDDIERDTRMHMFIIEHCNNDYLVDMMKKVFEKNLRIVIASQQNVGHIHEACDEHIEVLSALIDQDLDRASDLMRQHLGNCRRFAVDFFYK